LLQAGWLRGKGSRAERVASCLTDLTLTAAHRERTKSPCGHFFALFLVPMQDEAQIVDTRPSRERDVVLLTPDRIGGMGPVTWNAFRPNVFEEFTQTLNGAVEEKPLQAFFERHPQALLAGLVAPHRTWVIPRPRLPKPTGEFWVPDFIVCDWTSVGPDWFIVELESPLARPLKEDGDFRRDCNHAIDQINSYRSFLEEHGHYLRTHGWPKIHGEFEGVIVIGRRTDPLRAEYPDRIRDGRRQKIEVMSYDRLLEGCARLQQTVSAWQAQMVSLLSKEEKPG
jgi:hypothetical protein